MKRQAPGIVHDRLVITNDTRFLTLVREFVSRNVQKSHLRREEENKVMIAVDEAVSNIIEHGYARDAEGSIDIEVYADLERFQVTIRDSARGFNPSTVKNPDIAEHVRLGKRKGLGIFLIRQVMDEVRYHLVNGMQNELTLVKYVRSPSS